MPFQTTKFDRERMQPIHPALCILLEKVVMLRASLVKSFSSVLSAESTPAGPSQ